MIGKFLPVVISQGAYPDSVGLEPVNNGLADGSGSLVFHLGQNCQTTFALNDRNNGPLVASPNDGVAFPVTNRLAGFNLGRSIVKSGVVMTGTTSSAVPRRWAARKRARNSSMPKGLVT